MLLESILAHRVSVTSALRRVQIVDRHFEQFYVAVIITKRLILTRLSQYTAISTLFTKYSALYPRQPTFNKQGK